MKKLLFFIFFIFSLHAKQLFNEQQVSIYIDQLTDTLFNPVNLSGSDTRELRDFSLKSSQVLLQKCGVYCSFWSMTKEYRDGELYEAFLGEVVDFIEQKSAEVALEELKNFYVPSKVTHQAVAKTISQLVRDELLARITQTTHVPAGALESYYGSLLLTKVHELIKKELKKIPYAGVNQQKPLEHAQTDCPVCYTDFSSAKKKIALLCGHALCADCLKRWYAEKGVHATCPLCRTIVTNIQDLIAIIDDPKHYSTPECPLCLYEFGPKIKRIFLRCGHNVCTQCLKNLYESKKEKIPCPTCKAEIDLKEYLPEISEFKE